jgi:hypothetical protein
MANKIELRSTAGAPNTATIVALVTWLLCCLVTSHGAELVACQGNATFSLPVVDMSRSNVEYLLEDCDHPVTLSLQSPTISNISIVVRGGTTLPHLYWGSRFTASNISVLVEDVRVPLSSPLAIVFWSLLDCDVRKVSVIIRNSVLNFAMGATSQRGLIVSLSQPTSPPYAPVHDLLIAVENSSIHATAVTSCLLINFEADLAFASSVSMLVLNSHVNLTLVQDNPNAADTDILFFSANQAANIVFRVTGSVLTQGVSSALCYGAITGRGAYPASSRVVLVRTVLSHENSSYIVEASHITLIGFAQTIIMGILINAHATLVLHVVDVTISAMLCSPNGYATTRLGPKMQIVSVEAIRGYADIVVSNVTCNMSARDDLLLQRSIAPLLPLNTTNPWMSFSAIALAATKGNASVSVSMTRTTWNVLLRPVLTGLVMADTGFNPTGLASLTITVALVGLMASTLTSSMITVMDSHLTLMEGSMYFQQDAITIATGVLVTCLVSLGSVDITNTTINVSGSTLMSAPGFPSWNPGTSGRFFELSYLVLATDFGGLMAASISGTQYAPFTAAISGYMASETASGPSFVRNESRIEMHRCTHTTSPSGGANIVLHTGGVAAFQNISTQGSLFLLDSVTSSSTAPSLVPYIAAWIFLDGGTIASADLLARNISLSAVNTSYVYALMTDTVSTVPLVTTIASSNISLSVSDLTSASGIPTAAAAPPLIAAAVSRTRILFLGQSNSISVLSTRIGNACNTGSTLFTADRVAAGSRLHVDIGCDVVCSDGHPVMCSGSSWFGLLGSNATLQTCPLCSPHQTDEPAAPPTQPLAVGAARGSVATSMIASLLVVALFSSALPSIGPAAAATSGIMRMSGALRLWQHCGVPSADLLGGSSSGDGDGDDPIFGDTADNPLGVELPVAAGLRFAAGAPVGNTVVVVVVVLLSQLLSLCRRRLQTLLSVLHVPPPHQWTEVNLERKAGGAREAMLRVLVALLPSLSLPTTLLAPYTILLVPTISASVALMSSADRSGVTITIGMIASVVWGGTAVVLAYHTVTLVASCDGRFVLQTRASGGAKAERSAQPPSVLATRARWWMEPTSLWSVRMAARPLPPRQRWLLERVVHPLVEPHRLRWYFAVEWLLAFAGGAVLGVASSADVGGACEAAVWASACVAGLGVAEVLLAVLLRPFAVRADCALTVAVASCGVAALSAALAGDGGDGDVSTAFAMLSSVLQLLSFLLGIVAIVLTREHRNHRLMSGCRRLSTGNATKALRTLRTASFETRGKRNADQNIDAALNMVAGAQSINLVQLVQLICSERRRSARRTKATLVD